MPPPTIAVPTRSSARSCAIRAPPGFAPEANRRLAPCARLSSYDVAMFSYEGKRALVTGGGRGIGRAIALAFARQGADVAIAARSRDELDQVAKEVEGAGRRAVPLQVDMASAEQAQDLVERAARDLGGLDVLVNNAGGIVDVPGAVGPLSEATLEAFDAMYAVNLRSPLFAAMAACRHMARQGT